MVDTLPTIESKATPGTYQYDAEQASNEELARLASRPYVTPFSSFTLDPTTGDVVKAWYRQESLVGDAISFFEERSAYYGEVADPDFNPFAYYHQNQRDYGDIVPYLDSGHFNHVRGPKQFDAVADSIRGELERRALMEQGGGLATILGIGTTLLSPEVLIPVYGWASKANVARKAITMGAFGGATVAGEEILHHQQQRARTFAESLNGVLLTTALLGGLGGVGAWMTRRGKPLDPESPNHPLREENLGPDEAGSEWDPNSGMSVSETMAENGTGKMTYDEQHGVQLELFPDEADEAADVLTPRFDPTATETIQRGPFVRALDWTQGKLGFTRSSTTVAALTASPKARALLTQLAEMGHHTRELTAGGTRRITAELLKETSVMLGYNVAQETLTRAYQDMMKVLRPVIGSNEFSTKLASDAAELRDATGFFGSKKLGYSLENPENLKGIPLPEFQYLVWRRLNGVQKAHPNDVVEQAIVRATKGYRGYFDKMVSRAIRTNLLSDKQKIENYFPQIWDTDAILANPQGLREAFEQKFAAISDPKKLEELIDSLIAKLSNRGDLDITDGLHKGGEFDLGKSGRMKARDLFIEADELHLFEGYLRKDVALVGKQYADDMGGRIVLREMFGAVDPKKIEKTEGLEGKNFNELTKLWEEIKEEFDQLKVEASKKGEDARKLERDKVHVGQAIINLRDRLLQVDRTPSEEYWGSAALYTGRMTRQWNYLRWMGGVTLSSQADVMTMSFSHGMGPHLRETLKNMGSIAKEAELMESRELAFILFGVEGSLSQSRTGRLMGIDDAMYHKGFGTGATRKVSGAFEGLTNWGASHMSFLNLMRFWNSRNKFITGHVVLGNLLDDAAAISKGAAKSTYQWRELGISDDVLKRIHQLTMKHGFDERKGNHNFRWPDTAKWVDEAGGLEAEQLLHVALNRAVDRAVITPGIADLPIYHSTAVGQLLFQFQSHGFAIVNKFMRNLDHGWSNGRQLDVLMSLAWGLSAGGFIYFIKDGVVKGKIEDDNWDPEIGTIIYESIDRSGLMTWMMPYVNSMMKLTAGPLADAGVPIEAPSRFQAQRWYQSLLGPTFGGAFIDIAEDILPHLAEGEIDKVSDTMKRMIPFQNLFWTSMLWRKAWGED